MTIEKQPSEFRGSNVENAIAAGLAKLRLARSEVNIEVIDQGSRGLLGIGSRDAVVRIMKLAPVVPEPEPQPEPEPEPEPEPQPEPEPEIIVPEEVEQIVIPVEPEPAPVIEQASSTDVNGRLTEEGETAVTVISELLEHMQVQATVSVDLSDIDDMSKRRINIIRVKGEDLGVIIGPRGETLDALQHISRLIVANRLHRRSRFVVDIQGYRERRQMALSRMAERMARKAVQRGSKIGLEAMPANERRIIHIALRSSDEVYTESTGEGNRRRVEIIPKK